jgi:hypothetical protein
VFRRTGPVIGTVAAVAFVMFPTMALAQVNIDQGKSAADIFSSVCTACHKTSRGLAAGKNSLMLSAFLREHYTASSDQASALAAYVLGAGGSEPAPKQKPEIEHARAEEPKTGEPKAGESKAGEPKIAEPKAGEPKTTMHPVRAAAKPEEDKRPKQDAKREEHVASPPGPEKPEPAPETASREVTPTPDDAAHEAVPVSAAPTPAPVANASQSAAEPPNSAPKSEATPTASTAVPADEQHSAGAAVPRDNIPD